MDGWMDGWFWMLNECSANKVPIVWPMVTCASQRIQSFNKYSKIYYSCWQSCISFVHLFGICLQSETCSLRGTGQLSWVIYSSKLMWCWLNEMSRKMEAEPGRRSDSVGGVSAPRTEAASSPAAAQGLSLTCGPWLHVKPPPPPSQSVSCDSCSGL